MAGRCEICAASSADASKPKGRLHRFLVEGRVLSLCAEHAKAFRQQRPESLDAAAELFHESSGRRSLLGRRSPLDRRQFPMRPEGRRRSAGRRSTDGD
jgi:hypothetical protein